MCVAKLYFKFENFSNGKAKFHYYNGDVDNFEKNLCTFYRTTKISELNKILEEFTDEQQVLYYMNTIEYLRFLDHYDKINDYYDSHIINYKLRRMANKEKILKNIRIKREFENWFKENGYKIPKVT